MTDDHELREPTDRPPNRTGSAVLAFLAFVVIYVLSLVPVVLCLEKSGLTHTTVESTVGIVYAPLFFFLERSESLQAFYGWQFDLMDH